MLPVFGQPVNHPAPTVREDWVKIDACSGEPDGVLHVPNGAFHPD